jgi:hypothetical protein
VVKQAMMLPTARYRASAFERLKPKSYDVRDIDQYSSIYVFFVRAVTTVCAEHFETYAVLLQAVNSVSAEHFELYAVLLQAVNCCLRITFEMYAVLLQAVNHSLCGTF